MVLSASSVSALHDYGSSWLYFNRQAIWTLLGFAALFVALRVDYHFWRRLTPLVLLVGFGLLVVVLLPGVGLTVNGSKSWLGHGLVAHAARRADEAGAAALCRRPARASRRSHGRPASDVVARAHRPRGDRGPPDAAARPRHHDRHGGDRGRHAVHRGHAPPPIGHRHRDARGRRAVPHDERALPPRPAPRRSCIRPTTR